MASIKRVLIASDHAGFELKLQLKGLLPDWQWEDLGPIDVKSVDYPDFAEVLGKKLAEGTADRGILICGSGVGMSIAANKVNGVRAAAVENPVAARLSREHNDANVLCLGSRFIAPEYGAEIARVWLSTPFSKNDRHVRRIEKIQQLEKK